MNCFIAKSALTVTLAGACLTGASPSHCQTAAPRSTAVVAGEVCDEQRRPIAGATVRLESPLLAESISVMTDAEGRFRIPGLAGGNYTLHVVQRGFEETIEGPFALKELESRSFSLLLKMSMSQRPSTDAVNNLPFSDEAHFTVAGVTDTTSLGGHGSDPVRRNSDALSKETAHLSEANSGASDEATIREQLNGSDNANLRFQLAEIEEKSGRSLDAVNDYQRAAQLDPSEAHLFAWGAELLLHRAFDPAIEVFGKGRKLYPDSVRMILGLGAATYATGSADNANRIFLQACDVTPTDPTPYLFLGRVQVTENELPAGWTDRLQRFVELEPKNAQAHYFYAVALTKKPTSPEQLALAESQLKTAVDLDPHFGDTYLQLGILASQRGDLPDAATYLQKAVEYTALPDDAHYRLAQVYRRMGETEKARQQTELYKQASEKKQQQVEQARHELQQFVYTLREQSVPPMSAPDAH